VIFLEQRDPLVDPHDLFQKHTDRRGVGGRPGPPEPVEDAPGDLVV